MGGYTKDFRNLLTILKNREEKIARVAAALKVNKSDVNSNLILRPRGKNFLTRASQVNWAHVNSP